MLAAQPCGFIGMDDRLAGKDGEVLRIRSEPHQQQVPWLPVIDEHSIEARLAIQRSLKLAIGRRAAVSRDIDDARADLSRDMDCHACAVQPKRQQPPLMAERRTKALPRRSDDVI